MFTSTMTVVLAALISSAATKQCINITVPVMIEARQGTFAIPDITTNEDVTAFFSNFTSIAGGTNYTAKVLTGYKNVGGAANISARFCMPDKGAGSKPVVQVLTHGIGFDKSYWDISYNNFNYSYIDVAVDTYGYCTLSYDRFGIGNSSHDDPYGVVQAPAEVSALYQINTMLREGKLPGVHTSFAGKGTIVNVGHSFGSQQTYMLAASYPNVTDALILTGFSFNSSFTVPTVSKFNSKVARLNQPLRFGSTMAGTAVAALSSAISTNHITLTEVYQLLASFNLTASEITDLVQTTEVWDLIAGSTAKPYPVPQDLPPGYCTWSDAQANQADFFYTGAYDPYIVFFSEQTKQPFTLGEILTLGGKPSAIGFTGPVQILTGQQDAVYCGGDCLNTGLPDVASIPAAAAAYFPSASPFSTHIQPNTGHAINAHYSATSAYAEIMSFLKSSGISPG